MFSVEICTLLSLVILPIFIPSGKQLRILRHQTGIKPWQDFPVITCERPPKWRQNYVRALGNGAKVIGQCREFLLRNKTCFLCLHSLVKTEANVWENSRADQWKPETQSKFSPAREFSNFARGFQQDMEAWKTCFISFIKLLFSVLTKRKTIYEALTIDSHNTESVKPYCSRHFRAS